MVVILIGHKTGSKEFEYNKVTATTMYNALKGKIDVMLDSYNTEVYEEIAYIKSLNLKATDIVISVHNNAGGGDGFECFYYKGDSKGLAICQSIEKEVLKVGQNSRGCKADTGYAIIKSVTPTSIILEGAFMDNAKDWGSMDLHKMGQAYAIGVLNYLGKNVNTVLAAENYMVFNGKRYKIVE